MKLSTLYETEDIFDIDRKGLISSVIRVLDAGYYYEPTKTSARNCFLWKRIGSVYGDLYLLFDTSCNEVIISSENPMSTSQLLEIVAAVNTGLPYDRGYRDNRKPQLYQHSYTVSLLYQ